MRLIHYGSKFELSSFRPVQNYINKPKGGLWASPVDSNWGWKEWCEENDFGDLSSPQLFDFEGKILVIDGYEDLESLPYITMWGMKCLDAEKLALEYDAIWLTEKGQQETWEALYGWDCECVLIMNPQGIQPQ